MYNLDFSEEYTIKLANGIFNSLNKSILKNNWLQIL